MDVLGTINPSLKEIVLQKNAANVEIKQVFVLLSLLMRLESTPECDCQALHNSIDSVFFDIPDLLVGCSENLSLDCSIQLRQIILNEHLVVHDSAICEAVLKYIFAKEHTHLQLVQRSEELLKLLIG